LKTLPSLPVPTNSDPSLAAATDHRNGAAVSYTRSVAGPRTSCPAPSIERLSTSPFRKSLCAAASKNFGDEAESETAASAAAATAAAKRG
jgi:hypothetical protein